MQWNLHISSIFRVKVFFLHLYWIKKLKNNVFLKKQQKLFWEKNETIKIFLWQNDKKMSNMWSMIKDHVVIIHFIYLSQSNSSDSKKVCWMIFMKYRPFPATKNWVQNIKILCEILYLFQQMLFYLAHGPVRMYNISFGDMIVHFTLF